MTNLIVSVNCKWSSWQSHTTCPVTCGGGTQIRTRTKLVLEDHGGICSGLSYQERQCNTDPCPGISGPGMQGRYSQNKFMIEIIVISSIYLILILCHPKQPSGLRLHSSNQRVPGSNPGQTFCIFFQEKPKISEKTGFFH